MEATVRDVLGSGKRDRLEIVAAILALTQKSASVTYVMSHLGFSYGVLRKYLKFMIEKCLIEKREVTKTAKTTTHVYQSTDRGEAARNLL